MARCTGLFKPIIIATGILIFGSVVAEAWAQHGARGKPSQQPGSTDRYFHYNTGSHTDQETDTVTLEGSSRKAGPKATIGDVTLKHLSSLHRYGNQPRQAGVEVRKRGKREVTRPMDAVKAQDNFPAVTEEGNAQRRAAVVVKRDVHHCATVTVRNWDADRWPRILYIRQLASERCGRHQERQCVVMTTEDVTVFYQSDDRVTSATLRLPKSYGCVEPR